MGCGSAGAGTASSWSPSTARPGHSSRRDGVIADGDDVAVSLAGVMGGLSTEISPATSTVLLEMAWWDPMTIARTSRRLNLRSDAATRFERGTDPLAAEHAMARFAELLAQSSPVEPWRRAWSTRPGNWPGQARIRVRTRPGERAAGPAAGARDIRELIEPIGFEAGRATCRAADGELTVTSPSYRPDTTIEVDVVEEVARQYGYSRIPASVPTSSRAGGLTPRQQDRRLLRRTLVGLGLTEAMPLPFLAPGDLAGAGLDADAVTVTNPLDAKESVLRTSLRPGLLKTIAYNASHRVPGAELFELGHVYLPVDRAAELPDEREQLGVALSGGDAAAAVEVWLAVRDALALPASRAAGRPSCPASTPPGRPASRWAASRWARSARSTRRWSTPTACTGGWDGWSWTSRRCWACPTASPATARSAAIPPPTSTSPSPCPTRCRPPRWRPPCARRPATCSPTCGSSTCTGTPRSGEGAALARLPTAAPGAGSDAHRRRRGRACAAPASRRSRRRPRCHPAGLTVRGRRDRSAGGWARRRATATLRRRMRHSKQASPRSSRSSTSTRSPGGGPWTAARPSTSPFQASKPSGGNATPSSSRQVRCRSRASDPPSAPATSTSASTSTRSPWASASRAASRTKDAGSLGRVAASARRPSRGAVTDVGVLHGDLAPGRAADMARVGRAEHRAQLRQQRADVLHGVVALDLGEPGPRPS